MPNKPIATPADPPRPGLNPGLHKEVDRGFAEAQHGSDPMAKVSQKSTGPAVWPLIWAVVAIGLALLTLYLMFG